MAGLGQAQWSAPARFALSGAGLPLAGWWRRARAYVLDLVIVLVSVIVLDIVVNLTVASSLGSNAQGWLFIALLITSAGVYFSALNGLGSGRTVGNRASRIAVRDFSVDRPIGLGRGALRWLARMLMYVLVVPGLLNDLWPLWDERNQTLSDKLVRSAMVRTR
jgi:hypothetical protein